MRRTIHVLSSALEEKGIIRLRLEQLTLALSVSRAAVLLLDPPGDALTIAGAGGFKETDLSKVGLQIDRQEHLRFL